MYETISTRMSHTHNVLILFLLRSTGVNVIKVVLLHNLYIIDSIVSV